MNQCCSIKNAKNIIHVTVYYWSGINLNKPRIQHDHWINECFRVVLGPTLIKTWSWINVILGLNICKMVKKT